MTLFSRCDETQRFDPALNSPVARRMRVQGGTSTLRSVLAGFVEDIGILFRYAAGLDYYSGERTRRKH